MTIKELSIADLAVIKQFAADRHHALPLDASPEEIDFWDTVYVKSKEEINNRINEIFKP